MKELAFGAVETAKVAGATYADIRIVDSTSENVSVKNGVPSFQKNEDIGFGVRVIADGAWGFAASPRVTKEEIDKTVKKAVEIARASATVGIEKVRLAPEPVHKDKWTSTFIIDPFKIPIEKKLDVLLKVDQILRKDQRVTAAHGEMDFWREHQFFISSEGSDIDQTILRSGGGFGATAFDPKTGEIQNRSYPGVQADQYMQLGWEVIESYDYPANAERVREEAIGLLYADPCPHGELDIIIDGNQLALQIHESLGHPTELDRVFGMEANFAGTSFLTTEKLNNFKYGSDIVNIVGDGTAPGGLATVGYDDDGVRAQRWFMVQDGILRGYLTNRELAHRIGEDRSKAANRADGWQNAPMIRMTNISLVPGSWELPDLIADTEKGLFITSNKSWSIDHKRLNFQFTTEIGWLIENGKITKMVKNPTYFDMTPRFWGSCDAICNEKYWTLWGVNNCGKGQPIQGAEMSHGAAPSRFRRVKVGMG
jgi:TldD protein